MEIRTLAMILLSIPLSFCLLTPAQAELLDEDDLPLSHWFAGAGVGLTSPIVTHQTNFANSGMPGFPDDKYVTNDWDTSPLISFTWGYQWRFAADWFNALSLALAYQYSQPKFKGDIYVNSLDDARNFHYQYTVKQNLLQALFKLSLFTWYEFMPYLSLGAGIASNDIDNYSEAPIPGETVFDKRYQFTSAVNRQFASSIGIGVDYFFKENMAFTVGYRFTSIGNVETGQGQGVLSANRLINKVSLNSLELQVLYFF